MAIESRAVRQVLGNVEMNEEADNTLVISVRRRSLVDGLHLAIGLVLAVAAGVSTPEVLHGEPVWSVILVVIVDLVILAFIYTSLAHIFNRTILRVTDAGVEIHDAPLPLLLQEDHPQRVVGIKRVAYESHPIMILLPWQLMSQRNFRLAAICWDGKHRIMLPMLSTRAEARVVKTAIEKRLNLPPAH